MLDSSYWVEGDEFTMLNSSYQVEEDEFTSSIHLIG